MAELRRKLGDVSVFFTKLVAKLLGFGEADIQILMAAGKLTPLGDPAPNAPKWFAAGEMIRLAADQDWLHKATKEISKYWRHKRERRQVVAPRGGGERVKATSDCPLPRQWIAKTNTLKAVFSPCYPHLDGDRGGFLTELLRDYPSVSC